jgi:hypothetical protein
MTSEVKARLPLTQWQGDGLAMLFPLGELEGVAEIVNRG